MLSDVARSIIVHRASSIAILDKGKQRGDVRLILDTVCLGGRLFLLISGAYVSAATPRSKVLSSINSYSMEKR